jgi:hypothetical protein
LVVFYLFVGRGRLKAIERLGNPELIAALSWAAAWSWWNNRGWKWWSPSILPSA